tara:strand:- start:493 stop:1050 length:558 start_codon:yes stop_codon:yes gene_type:complete
MTDCSFKRCNICFDEDIDAEREMCVTNCSHSYCLTCITEWFYHNTNCPLCRKEFVLNDVYHFKYFNFIVTKEKIFDLKALLLFNEISNIQNKIDEIDSLLSDLPENPVNKPRLSDFIFKKNLEKEQLENDMLSKFSQNTWILSNKIVKSRIKLFVEKYILENKVNFNKDKIKLNARNFLEKLGVF